MAKDKRTYERTIHAREEQAPTGMERTTTCLAWPALSLNQLGIAMDCHQHRDDTLLDAMQEAMMTRCMLPFSSPWHDPPVVRQFTPDLEQCHEQVNWQYGTVYARLVLPQTSIWVNSDYYSARAPDLQTGHHG